MPNYQLSKVYQIVCLTTGHKYVGATTQKTLAERLAGHNRSLKRWKNGKGDFLTSFTILEQGNYQIELLEAFPCNSKDELNAREGHFIRTVECVNKCIIGRTYKEYYDDNRSDLIEKSKTYNKDHKLEKDEYMKTYRKNNKNDLAEYRKAYNEINKDKKAEYQKAYYQKKKSQANI